MKSAELDGISDYKHTHFLFFTQLSSDAAVNRLQGRRNQQPTTQSGPRERCQCCGRNNHVTSQCRFKDAICHGCNKKGHIKPVCPKRDKHLNTKHLDLDYSGDSNTGNSDSGSVDMASEKFHGVQCR